MSSLDATQCAVILVHYNNASDTLACLAALQRMRHAPRHIVVVDNNSRAEEVEALLFGWQKMLSHGEGLQRLSDMPSCGNPAIYSRNILLVLPHNGGFAAGNNAALQMLLAYTDCTAFWLLNNDTEPSPKSLDALCARLNEYPEAGLCGSTLMYAAEPSTVQAAGGCTCSPWTGRTAFLLGGATSTEVEALSLAKIQEIERATDYVVGASCLVRREVLEQAGLLPEDYFLYYEDAAFALNARHAGFKQAWACDSVVLHKEGGSTSASGGVGGRKVARPAYVDYLSIRNRVALIRRYWPYALPITLLSLLAVFFNRVKRGQAGRLPLLVRAAWHGLVGRMGPL